MPDRDTVSLTDLPPEALEANPTVFVSDSGKKFHRETCWCWARSKRKHPLALQDAVRGYAPCSLCLPTRWWVPDFVEADAVGKPERVAGAVRVHVPSTPPTAAIGGPAGVDAVEPLAGDEDGVAIVYLPRKGKKFHRESCWCWVFGQTMTPVPLEKALETHAPCSVCRPTRLGLPDPHGAATEQGAVPVALAAAAVTRAPAETPTAEAEPERRRGDRFWFLLVLAALFLACVIWALPKLLAPAQTEPAGSAPLVAALRTVPAVVDMAETRAFDALAALDLQPVAVYRDAASENKDGRVLEQRPAAGERVAPESVVYVTVGRLPDRPDEPDEGAPPVLPPAVIPTVPDVVGLSIAEAARVVGAAGYEPTLPAALVDAPERVGWVAGTTPAAGAKLAQGERVRFTASVPTPSVVGRSAPDAEEALRAFGLDPHTREIDVQDAGNVGQVVVQHPAAGARAALGSRVELSVGRTPTWSPPAPGPKVPDVVGRTREEAAGELRDAGYVVAWDTTRTTVRAEVGRVIVTAPIAGSGLAAGRTVRCFVAALAQGPDRPVENFVGLDRLVAEGRIHRAGFRYWVTLVETDEVADGVVLRQRPGAADALAPKGAIVLEVARVPEGAILVPKVIGLSYAKARSMLTRQAFRVAPPEADGTRVVVEQSLPAGKRTRTREITLTLGDPP